MMDVIMHYFFKKLYIGLTSDLRPISLYMLILEIRIDVARAAALHA